MSAPEVPSGGFYAILDTGYINDSEWEYKADAVLSGGARLLQIRAMGDPLERVRELVERVHPIARSHKVPLIINDHLELAVDEPGLGLHMGQADHSLEQAKSAIEAADILSYFTIGPVFSSQTHTEYRTVGIDLVSEVADLDPPIPFFCIGGITPDNLQEVIKAGARGVIAASFSLRDADIEATARFYAEHVNG